MIGRVITSFLLELLVCSTIYEAWKEADPASRKQPSLLES
jgi:hypothetical protein